MHAAVVRFPVAPGHREQVLVLVGDLLASWYKRGNILDGWVMAEGETELAAYVVAAGRDALFERGGYVGAGLERLEAAGAAPSIEILGRCPDLEEVCSCRSWEWLMLFTTYLTREPPLRCGHCFGPVPLWRVPTRHDDEHLGVLHWQADYQACDTLQMHTGTGERFGERELVRHDSSLSLRGRRLCLDLSGSLAIPVFYYLHKSRGRSRNSERARRCPGCDGDWLLPERRHIFDFKCDTCRLLSNFACNVT